GTFHPLAPRSRVPSFPPSRKRPLARRANHATDTALMSVLVDKNTRLLVQGITGNSGAFHARGCREYGTNVVAGVTPGKGGQKFDDTIPIFDTVYEAREKTGCNATMIFV